MITGISVEDLRGIEKLDLQDIGRVNLLIGRNDCGKTTALEALHWAKHIESSAHALFSMQRLRDWEIDLRDFERAVAPLFRDADARRGARIEVRHADGSIATSWAGRSDEPLTIAPSADASGPPPWALNIRTSVDGVSSEEKAVWNGASFELPQPRSSRVGWIRPYANVTAGDVRNFSRLKAAGTAGEPMNCVRLADDTITDIELLSPDGKRAELWVRRASGPALPLYTLGQGVIRIIEIALVLASGNDVFVDEFENGIHHSVLQGLWTSIARMSAASNRQIFASSHSEESIQAACRAFLDANDDGLRVIRIDRTSTGTRASIYDAAAACSAGQLGVEVRG